MRHLSLWIRSESGAAADQGAQQDAVARVYPLKRIEEDVYHIQEASAVMESSETDSSYSEGWCYSCCNGRTDEAQGDWESIK